MFLSYSLSLKLFCLVCINAKKECLLFFLCLKRFLIEAILLLISRAPPIPAKEMVLFISFFFIRCPFCCFYFCGTGKQTPLVEIEPAQVVLFFFLQVLYIFLCLTDQGVWANLGRGGWKTCSNVNSFYCTHRKCEMPFAGCCSVMVLC